MVTETSMEAIMERLMALEAANAKKDAQIEQLREEANAAANGDYKDSLVKAMEEFRAQNERDLGGIMSGPCLQCGKTWRDQHGEIRMEHNPRVGHSFVSYKNKIKPAQPGTYQNGSRPISRVEKPEDVYLTTHDAARMLNVSVKKVSTLINQGVLKADKYGAVTLVHTESVNRILAEIEVAANAGA